MLVRLTAKLAEVVNGVDLSQFEEGEVIDLPERQARMLIAERWAEVVEPGGEWLHKPPGVERVVAADREPQAEPGTRSTRSKSGNAVRREVEKGGLA